MDKKIIKTLGPPPTLAIVFMACLAATLAILFVMTSSLPIGLLAFSLFIFFLYMGKLKAVGERSRETVIEPVPSPVKKFIRGVGIVYWITDPRQLESPMVWSKDTVKQMERELLTVDPHDWLKEGWKVVTDEVEKEAQEERDKAERMKRYQEKKERLAAEKDNKYDYSSLDRLMEQLKSIHITPPALVAETHEVSVAEREEPLATFTNYHVYPNEICT